MSSQASDVKFSREDEVSTLQIIWTRNQSILGFGSTQSPLCLSSLIMVFSMTKHFPVLKNWKPLFTFAVPIVLLPIPLIIQAKTAYAAYSVLIMASYWMTEAIPIPVTSLLPVVLFPLFGICDTGLIVREYLKDSIMGFVGSLTIALAFEYCNLHKRVALRVVLFTGVSSGRLMLGVMLTTMFLSMWMFNTAATAMMVPIIVTIVDELEAGMKAFSGLDDDTKKPNMGTENEGYEGSQESLNEEESSHKNGVNGYGDSKTVLSGDIIMEHDPSGMKCMEDPVKAKKREKLLKVTRNMRTMFLLSICYSSNIGGTGVVTGSGTNIVALEFIGNLDPKHHGDYAVLSFATWMAFNIPPMLANTLVAWVYLQVVFLGIPNKFRFWMSKKKREESNALIDESLEVKIRKMLYEKYLDLGPLSLHEILVAVVFFITVLSWIFHEPKFIPGWSSFFPHTRISLTTSALLFAVLFYVIPRNPEFYKAFRTGDFRGVQYKPLLDYEFTKRKFPWGSIILLGGGYAMSYGAKKAGLSSLIGQSMGSLRSLPGSAIQIIVMSVIAFITEIASNAATASIVIPVLLELSQELNIHPFYLTLPAAITCSYAFMLPVATVPNAIVYAASDMKIIDMMKTGFFMNCSCVIILYLFINMYGNLFFHFTDYTYMP